MKKLYLLILVVTNICNAQAPFNFQAFQKEFESITGHENAARERFLASPTDTFTVASTNFDIKFYRCEWQVDPAVNYINGSITSVFNITSTTNTITFDLNRQLIVDSVLYHGSNITFLQTPDNGVVINFPASISSSTIDSVTIWYQGIPDASGLGAFVQTGHNGVPVIWTLSEPYGAREWWPCKNVLSDKADSVEIIITSPSAYRASSNGLLLDEQISGSNRICHFKHGYPISSYLVAMAVTNYVINSDTIQVGNKTTNLISYAYPEYAGGFFASQSWTKDAFHIFSNLFGEYPFAKERYGNTQFGWGGGMEHQSNSFVYNTSPNLSAHELAHQWFGDMITCGSWSDLWLNEGFATYNTALFLEYGLYPVYYLPYMQNALNSIVSQPDGSVYIPDTTSVARLFSARLTYNKGSYVLHMLRWVLGDSTYFRAARRYLNDPVVKYGYARTTDLQRNFELESGRSLNSFFQKWVYGEGYANYYANWTQNANKWVNLKLDQTTSHPSVSFYEMPVQLVLRGATKDTTVIVDHRFSGQEYWFNVGFDVDTVIIDPDIWILAKDKISTKLSGSTKPNELKVFPNPAPGEVFISLINPSDKKLTLQLFNNIGQLVFSKQLQTPGQDELINIPVSRFAKGVYWLKIRSEKNINYVKKLVH